jgi:glyoxylase-like metal-dependent hydrolase (beta-lactamase superfamily II)
MSKRILSFAVFAVLVAGIALGGAPANAYKGGQIMTEQINGGMGNCFIISQGGSAVLVDTGTTKYRDAILGKCKAANVRLIVLTHGHYDHVQNAAYLSRELGVPVAMHPANVPLLENILAEPVEAHVFSGKAAAAVIRLGQRPRLKKFFTRVQKSEIEIFVPDIELHDGFSLAPYGVDAKAIVLPGHTRGSIGVLAGGDFLVGDALMNIGKPGRALHYADRAAMEDSAGKISALGEDVTVWFGHGKPVKNRVW